MHVSRHTSQFEWVEPNLNSSEELPLNGIFFSSAMLRRYVYITVSQEPKGPPDLKFGTLRLCTRPDAAYRP